MTFASDSEGWPYGRAPTGAPSDWLHCGTIWRRFSVRGSAGLTLSNSVAPRPRKGAAEQRRAAKRDVLAQEFPAARERSIERHPLLGFVLSHRSILRGLHWAFLAMRLLLEVFPALLAANSRAADQAGDCEPLPCRPLLRAAGVQVDRGDHFKAGCHSWGKPTVGPG
jgi:hypothetical protein